MRQIEVSLGIPILALFGIIVQDLSVEVHRTLQALAGLKTLHDIFELAQDLVTHRLLRFVYYVSSIRSNRSQVNRRVFLHLLNQLLLLLLSSTDHVVDEDLLHPLGQMRQHLNDHALQIACFKCVAVMAIEAWIVLAGCFAESTENNLHSVLVFASEHSHLSLLFCYAMNIV